MDDINNVPNEVSTSQKGTSNTAITILVIISLLVTIISTWAVLNSINPVGSPAQKTVNTDSGKVSVTVLGDTQNKSDDIGRITLNIESPK